MECKKSPWLLLYGSLFSHPFAPNTSWHTMKSAPSLENHHLPWVPVPQKQPRLWLPPWLAPESWDLPKTGIACLTMHIFLNTAGDSLVPCVSESNRCVNWLAKHVHLTSSGVPWDFIRKLRLEFLFLKIVLRNQGLFLSSFASGKGKGIQNTNCCNEKRFDYFCL